MPWLALFLFVVLPSHTGGNAGFFSSQAVLIGYEGSAISPDGKKILKTRYLDDNAPNHPTEVIVTAGKRTLKARIRFGLNAQVLWNKDSTAFAITGSEGGGNGSYETSVFRIQHSRLEVVPLTVLIYRAFGHPFQCDWKEHPNVGAVGWTGKNRILIAAQVINHSNCDSFGTFKLYEVDIAERRITRVINQIRAKRMFPGLLGTWLIDADDGCIRNPASCRVNRR